MKIKLSQNHKYVLVLFIVLSLGLIISYCVTQNQDYLIAFSLVVFFAFIWFFATVLFGYN